MCGIAGFNWRDRELGSRMSECLQHRGPDAQGAFDDEGVTLSHKRLAIIDLSPEANQPMLDSSGRFAIVFNGEIYNYRDLRKELSSSYNFKTESDTEVILAGYQRWGSKMPERLNGIFALAIWDKVEGKLFCARDHIGVKPFYYYWDGEKFIFASEIKSILTHDVERSLNVDSFNKYMRVLYAPEPETMIRNIYKLPPGSSLSLLGNNFEINHFYTPALEPQPLSYSEAVKRVRDTIDAAVKRQMVADVPVGVYLSGGIDSSAVLSSAIKVNPNIKTFSIGFDLGEGEEKDKFNRDFELAQETAKFFGSDHKPLIISTKDVADNLVEIIGSIDDPISNPTAIPMALLSRFAKREVTVVLSGNGGDELFGGYERYRMSRRVDLIAKIPGAKHLLPKKVRSAIEMSALDRLAQFEFEKDYRLEKVVNREHLKQSGEIKKMFAKYVSGHKDKTEALMMADLASWLPDQALLLGDKMSMRGSVEERVPLIDREVVGLAMSLPIGFKTTAFAIKRILKDAFRDRLPKQLFDEPKRGWFSPGAKWLRRKEILTIVREVLSEGYYSGTKDLFDWTAIKKMLEDHVEKREYNLTILWAILTFQIWAKKYQIKL